jgi:predicted amidohydrolase YtcJ
MEKGLTTELTNQQLREKVIKDFDLDLAQEADRITLDKIMLASGMVAIQEHAPVGGPITRRIKDFTGGKP